jgi:predicted transcriptional regulator
MPTTERVTVTLPSELVENIDRLAKNRSRFIAQAGEHVLARHRHEDLRRSLEHPHPEAAELADAGLDEWAASLPEGGEGLVDMSAGTPVRWVEGEGALYPELSRAPKTDLGRRRKGRR